jgi:hypothetical protein
VQQQISFAAAETLMRQKAALRVVQLTNNYLCAPGRLPVEGLLHLAGKQRFDGRCVGAEPSAAAGADLAVG